MMLIHSLPGRSSRRPRFSVTPTLEALERREVPASIFWNTDADGAWHSPSNWIDDLGQSRLPAFNDDVFLDRESGPVTVDFLQGSVTVNSLWAGSSSLVIRGGTLGLRSQSMLSAPFTLNGGRFVVDGPLYLLGDASWIGGTVDGNGTVENYATVTLSGSDPKFLRGSFTNYGTVVHTGTADFQVTAFARFDNQAGALYELQTDADLAGEGAFTGQFNNLGTLRKSSGDGTSLVSAVNNQGGLIEVFTGTVGLGRAGKTHTGGTFDVAAGATLDLTSGATNDRFTGTYTGYGEGKVVLATGTLALGGTGATFDFPWGLFEWTGGRIEAGSPGLTNAGSIFLTGPAPKDLRGTLTNTGWFVQVDTGDFVLPAFATFQNQQSGSYVLASDANVLGEGAFSGRLNNVGLFYKTGEGGQSQFHAEFANVGGRLEVNYGTLLFTRELVQRGGSTVLSGGSLSAPLFNIVSGRVEGAGVITGNVRNGGIIEVGGRGVASYLILDGDYEQLSSGNLIVELGSFAQQNWDYLHVTGRATLAGRLTVWLLEGFSAAEGDGYWVLLFGTHTGNFTTVDLPDVGPDFDLEPVLDDFSLTLLTQRRA